MAEWMDQFVDFSPALNGRFTWSTKAENGLQESKVVCEQVNEAMVILLKNVNQFEAISDKLNYDHK